MEIHIGLGSMIMGGNLYLTTSHKEWNCSYGPRFDQEPWVKVFELKIETQRLEKLRARS